MTGAQDYWGDERPAVEGVLRWAAHRVVSPSDPKTTARLASDLAAAAGPTVTADGIGWQRALQVFDEVLVPATRAQDDPMNLAYVPSAPTRTAIAFDLATSAANIFGGLWEAGAGAIFAENEALAWLVELLGWPADAGGTFVQGGTLGNLSALVAARETIRNRRGRRPPGGWVLACTADAHSSIRGAARALDVEVVEVPEDARGHLTGDALHDVLRRHPNVFAVVASAGTTNTGVVDDLADIADECAEHDVWLHVDGAYGGAALAAPSVRARYLDVIDREQWNPSDLAVHLTRRARGLPFWFSLATHGTSRYTAAVERALDTARAVAAGIAQRDHLRLVLEPELSVLLFERPGWTDAQVSAWSRQQALDGVILCLPTQWLGRTVLRLAFVNPETQAERVLAALDTLR